MKLSADIIHIAFERIIFHALSCDAEKLSNTFFAGECTFHEKKFSITDEEIILELLKGVKGLFLHVMETLITCQK